ncbi:hypothetical protein P7K49_027502, partial [Saguinus oedipus]
GDFPKEDKVEEISLGSEGAAKPRGPFGTRDPLDFWSPLPVAWHDWSVEEIGR